MKKFTVAIFAAMCLVQWFVPAKMIYDSERVIRDGIPFRFKTLPIDPSDPFRGKYITLNFEEDAIAVADDSTWTPGQVIYVTFTKDSAGFAKTSAVAKQKPSQGDYLKTTVSYTSRDPYLLHFDLPFDRFYLEESKASQAEQAYWKAQSDSTRITYGLVAIREGTAVLKDVMINDKSIVEVVRALNAEAD